LRWRVRVLLVMALALLGVGIVPPVMTSADSSTTAHIFGTKIGLMFRSDPNNWDSRQGPAGYDGDLIVLECQVMGTPVGPNGNRTWYYGRTRFGTNWVPDHFTDTPIKASQWLPGLPQCGQQNASASSAQASPASVFFSGTNNAHGPAGMAQVSDLDIRYDDWKSNGDCAPTNAANRTGSASILAGWSKGRLGPIYTIMVKPQQIHTIILFDPGDTANFTGACDTNQNINVNAILAGWLNSNRANHLVVYTGAISEEQGPGRTPVSSAQALVSGAGKRPGLTFAGLWHYYFAGIWNQPFADRALVCDYFNTGHDDIVNNYHAAVQASPTACLPSVDPTNHTLTPWHP